MSRRKRGLSDFQMERHVRRVSETGKGKARRRGVAGRTALQPPTGVVEVKGYVKTLRPTTKGVLSQISKVPLFLSPVLPDVPSPADLSTPRNPFCQDSSAEISFAISGVSRVPWYLSHTSILSFQGRAVDANVAGIEKNHRGKFEGLCILFHACSCVRFAWVY